MGTTAGKSAKPSTSALLSKEPDTVNPKPNSDDDLEELANHPTHDANDLEGVTDFDNHSYTGADKWFANPKLSNYTEWVKNMTSEDDEAVSFYTGSGYSGLNQELYNKKWEDMSPGLKKLATNFYNFLNKFELNKAIHVTRGAKLDDVMGVKMGMGASPEETMSKIKANLSKTDGVMQFNGFQSTSTGSVPAYGSMQLIIHYTIPPSKGAGGYVRPISEHGNEREFTINNNAVVKFDESSLKYEYGGYHINAEWLGQAKDQKFKKKK